MCKNKTELEKPFEYLKRKNGEAFSSETVTNWYKARAYVLDKLNHVALAPDDDKPLQVVIVGDSPLMLSVVRQVALSAHYANYEEHDMHGLLTCKNQTVITLVSQNEKIVDELKKEEYLCNLPDYCKCSVFGKEENADSYIDIKLQIVKEPIEDKGVMVYMTDEEAKRFVSARNDKDIYEIDTRNAVYASRMYDLGDDIGNLPAENIHDAKRYRQALSRFQHVQMRKGITPLVDKEKWEGNLNKVKKGLSNLFCSDCFLSRRNSIKAYWEKELIKKKEDRDKKLKQEDDVWEKYNKALSQSEHERWVVEKLVLGYRPLNDEERYQYENLFGESRKAYCKELKNNASDPVHIDLCSYHDLRRINPDDLKYDSFLMLAIPAILNKTKNSKS